MALAFDDVASTFPVPIVATNDLLTRSSNELRDDFLEEIHQIAVIEVSTSSSYRFKNAVNSLLLKAGSDKVYVDMFTSLRQEQARAALDFLQNWLDLSHDELFERQHRIAIYLLIKLASNSGELPPSLFLSGVEIATRDPDAVGGFADIFRGTYQGVAVAIKRLRLSTAGRDDIHKIFCKEALVWRQLSHPHVLPFLGVDVEIFEATNFICMVSLWLSRGTLLEYVLGSGFDTKERERLLREIADGLTYLHSRKVVHGDIHGGNIFLDDQGRACLADFGISIVGDETTARMTTAALQHGTLRWMSPERLSEDGDDHRLRSSVDVWAFGCLFILLYTRQQPYYKIRSNTAVLFHIIKGSCPDRPEEGECYGGPLSDELWDLATRCWTREIHLRPSMRTVHGWLVEMTSPELSSTNDHASSVPNSVLDGETRTSPTSGVDELIEDRPPSPFRVVQSLTPPNPLEPNVIKSVPRWKHSPQVLVVDDDAVNRTLLCRLLQKFGCLTEVAGDGAAAVKMAKQGNYDLVLMDISMPQGLDGDSATLMIHQFHPGMPIVAVTSASRPEDVENYLRRRMDGVLSKPVERGRLLKVLEKHLSHMKDVGTKDAPVQILSFSNVGFANKHITEDGSNIAHISQKLGRPQFRASLSHR